MYEDSLESIPRCPTRNYDLLWDYKLQKRAFYDALISSRYIFRFIYALQMAVRWQPWLTRQNRLDFAFQVPKPGLPLCFALLCFALLCFWSKFSHFQNHFALLCFARRSRFLKMKKSNFALLCFALLEVNLNFQNGRGRGKFWPKFWPVITIFGPFRLKIAHFSNFILISYLSVFETFILQPGLSVASVSSKMWIFHFKFLKIFLENFYFALL